MAKRKLFSNETGKLPALATDQTLTIRKSHLGEAFYLSGNGILRHCVLIQEFLGETALIVERYMTVIHPSFSAAAICAQPVLFREAISESGERFAYPQILYGEHPIEDAKTQVEQQAFEELLGHWITIDECEDCGNFCHSDRILYKDDLLDDQSFAQQLDSALLPHVIVDGSHPINKHLQDFLAEV